jgi:BON domain
MRKLLYLLSFALAMALAATAQTSSQTQTPPPVNPTTPANQIGSGDQTKAGTPAPSSTSSPNGQVNPPDATQPPAQGTSPNSSTGGVAGAASSSATQVPAGDNAAAGVATMTDSDLESQIQNALSKEPTLTGDSAHVKVAGDTIELGGNVGTSKEKITATRIVQSFAGSKKLVNHLSIGNGKVAPQAQAPDASDRNHPASTANPANNPEPNKGNPPKPPQE